MGNHSHMSNADRAKQFIPFAALKGYEEALHAKEKIIVPRIELSEDRQEELDRKLHLIHRGDMISVIYFHNYHDYSLSYDFGEYLKITGMISSLDTDTRILQVVNEKIKFDDIYDLSEGQPI